MILRQYWLARIQSLFLKNSLLWLKGPLGVGKTNLLHQMSSTEYFDCERMQERERLMQNIDISGTTIVLDEIRFFPTLEQVLKSLLRPDKKNRVLCSSSVNWASLPHVQAVGRTQRQEMLLTTLLGNEYPQKIKSQPEQMLQQGGMISFLNSDFQLQGYVQDWQRRLWVDVVERTFRGVDKELFQKAFAFFAQKSGEVFDEMLWSEQMHITRNELIDTLRLLQACFCVFEIPAFESHKRKTAEPWSCFYFFDRVFPSAYQNLSVKSPDGAEILWRHMVFQELVGLVEHSSLFHAHDRIRSGIPFILSNKSGIHAIYVAFNEANVNLESLAEFRHLEPYGKNLVVSSQMKGSRLRRVPGGTPGEPAGELIVEYLNFEEFSKLLSGMNH